MDRRFVATLATENFVGTVGNDLVGVHVGLGARTGLPNHKREMVVELALDNFLRRFIDRLGDLFLELAEREISAYGGLFLYAKRVDE